MKYFIRILFTVILILALFYSAVYVFMIIKGKTLILKGLEGFTHRKVSIGYFDLTPSLNLEIRNLNIEGLAKAEKIFISPSITHLLTGNIALNRITIIRPQITFEKNLPGASELSTTTTAAPNTAVAVAEPVAGPVVKPGKKRTPHLIFKHFDIKEGKINFLDHTVGQEGIKIIVKDLNFNLTNLYLFPYSAIANFDLKGKIPWQEGKDEGKIEFEGWLNLFKKDMQATLKIEDIDGIYLYSYYSQWVDLEKARIEKAKLNFISDLHSLNNDLTVKYRIELTDIVFKPRAPEEEEHKAEKIAHAVLDIFKALNQDKIVLEHTFRTKMDRPEFSFGNIKMAFEDKLAQARGTSEFKPEDILMLPTRVLQGTVKGLTDLSKAVVDGTFAVGKEIKKSVEDAFKKDK